MELLLLLKQIPVNETPDQFLHQLRTQADFCWVAALTVTLLLVTAVPQVTVAEAVAVLVESTILKQHKLSLALTPSQSVVATEVTPFLQPSALLPELTEEQAAVAAVAAAVTEPMDQSG